MRTLFLNPPSFEGFDGGASSRWPATREIESYWYPVWLCYPAGMLPDSKVVDAPPHKISIEQTIAMANDFELLVLFTSTPGFHVDVKMAEMMKDTNPKLKVAFVGPPVTVEPEKTLRTSPAIDFVVRREFDYQIADYATRQAAGRAARRQLPQERPHREQPRRRPSIENLDELPWVTKVYKRDLDITPLQRSVPAESLHLVLHLARLPGNVHLLPVAANAFRPPLAPALLRRRRARSGATPWRSSPTSRKSSSTTTPSTIARRAPSSLCKKLKPLNFTWSCTSRVTTDYDTLKAMKDAGCRLLIVGYESGDQQILKNIKKGATIDMAAALHRQLQEAGPAGARRFHHRPARRNPREHPQDHRFRQATGYRNHPGFASPTPIPAPSSTTTSRRTTSSPSTP